MVLGGKAISSSRQDQEAQANSVPGPACVVMPSCVMK